MLFSLNNADYSECEQALTILDDSEAPTFDSPDLQPNI